MRRQLEYKQLWMAVRCLLFRQRTQASVARAVSYSERKSPVTKSIQMPGMWITANADVNGARNILAAGHAVLPVERWCSQAAR